MAPRATASSTCSASNLRTASERTGPISHSELVPTRIWPARSFNITTNESKIGCSTYTRLAPTQTWPAFENAAYATPSIVRARSQDANTRHASLPPSSRIAGICSAAHRSATIRPLRLDPVKNTRSGRASINLAASLGSAPANLHQSRRQTRPHTYFIDQLGYSRHSLRAL